jgi:hypothetical protein
MPPTKSLPSRLLTPANLANGLAACMTALLAAAPAAAAPVTYIRVLQTDATGRPNGPVFFETTRLPAQVVPLYLASGPSPNPDAPFINANVATQASVWLDLGPGLHTFAMVANQGTRNMTHASMTLAFGNDLQFARIGVLAPFWTDQTSAPEFAANPILGGALTYDDGQRRYELTDFFFASGIRYPGMDRVNDFGVGADGARDAIGQFTLRVTDRTHVVPTPGTLPLMLAAGLAAGLFSRRGAAAQARPRTCAAARRRCGPGYPAAADAPTTCEEPVLIEHTLRRCGFRAPNG